MFFFFLWFVVIYGYFVFVLNPTNFNKKNLTLPMKNEVIFSLYVVT